LIRHVGSIGGIILAAGSSSRLGTPKQLLLWQGKPLVRVIAEKLLSTEIYPMIVVVGVEKKTIKEALDGLEIRVVENPLWKIGISTSIHAGISALPENTQAAVFATSDQPFIPNLLIEKILQNYVKTGASIICPICKGVLRNPVLFDKKHFLELSHMKGDTGGKTLFKHHEVSQIEWEIEDDFRDIDTQSDMAKLYGKIC
jgi:molybdenum cofactor cytidylyltransferase